MDRSIIQEPTMSDMLPEDYNSKVYGHHIKQLQGITEWIKGFRVFEDLNLVVVWKKEILSDNQGTVNLEDAISRKKQKVNVRPRNDQVICFALDKCKLLSKMYS
jgi:hypothetical protein